MLGRKKVLDQQITTENIHKHRKAILRNGRKFKFPVQYLQHRVIINTIIIGFLAILIVAGVGGWQLYFMKNTGDVLYGITRVLPLSVAKIDKWSVKYSDYLMLYRSSIAVIERQEGKLQETAENAERLKMYKRLALDTAEENALTMGLAKDMGVSVAR
ncbi:MAG: SurA N-terminal domain-containing protein, partial [Candidatus Nomurabacteria bacterium]|nr:SurA N-terminal domain-containing protein [Candidatus Nomurabacteria bacterium]